MKKSNPKRDNQQIKMLASKKIVAKSHNSSESKFLSIQDLGVLAKQPGNVGTKRKSAEERSSEKCPKHQNEENSPQSKIQKNGKGKRNQSRDRKQVDPTSIDVSKQGSGLIRDQTN